MADQRNKWPLIYKGKIEDFDNSAADYWKDKSATKKFRETRSLIELVMKQKGISYSELSRPLRTTAVIKRQ